MRIRKFNLEYCYYEFVVVELVKSGCEFPEVKEQSK